MTRLPAILLALLAWTGGECAHAQFPYSQTKHYYKLDSTGFLADSVASGGVALTNVNSATNVTGKINQGAHFVAGSSQYLSATLPVLNSATKAILNGWVYRTSTGHLIGFGTAGSANNRFGVIVSTDGNIYVTCSNGSNSYGSCANTIGTSTFGMLTVLYDGTATGNANRLKLYINGSLQTLSFTGSIPATLATNASQGAFLIGADVSGFHTGDVDEVGIWTGVNWTQTEVDALWNGGNGLAWTPPPTVVPKILLLLGHRLNRQQSHFDTYGVYALAP